MTTAIRVENLGKSYRLGQMGTRAGYRTLRESLAMLASRPQRGRPAGIDTKAAESFWALRDVSFEVERGEVVGIIGRNGAGKSTLLKILSRITKPTAGRALLHGRVGSLLEVGTGFHPELTGRENIYLNGSILGIGRREITRRFDEIVAFAEVDAFLDTPVKRYSSGMYVRLAFAVAAHLETEILVVDEVLAVGDISFQRKCLGRMHSLSSGGRTVLFVSHNMPAVRSITQRCVYLSGGEVVCTGKTPEVLDRYLQDAWQHREIDDRGDLDFYRRDRLQDSGVRIHRILSIGADGKEIDTICSGDDIKLRIDFYAKRDLPRVYAAFWITNQQGERVATFLNEDARYPLAFTRGKHCVSCRIYGMPLSPGRYSVTIGLNEGVVTTALDLVVDYPLLRVVIPEVDDGTIEWPTRPWGSIHWTNVEWSSEIEQ